MIKEAKYSRLILIVPFLYNIILFIVCNMNILANNFVLKETVFYPIQIFSSTGILKWIIYSPLLLPVWYQILNKFADLSILRRFKPLLLITLVLLVSNFPFAYVNLFGNKLAIENILHYMIRDGIAQPSALIISIVCISLFFNKSKFFSNISLHWKYLLFTGLTIGVIIKALLSGATIPRLEDEIAFFVQSLIFEAGHLVATFKIPPGLYLDQFLANNSIPFIIYKNDHFYSAHLHGWSFILYLLSFLKLKYYANIIFTLLNFWLFYIFSGKIFSNDDRVFHIISMILFTFSPILLLLSNTFMSHTFTLTILLTFMIIWERMGRRGKQYIDLRFIYLFISLSLLAIIFAFTRPQVMLPVFLGIISAETLMLLATIPSGKIKKRESLNRIMRLICIFFAVGVSYVCLVLYARFLNEVNFIFMESYMQHYLVPGCQALGFGEGYGCFPTYGTMGHSFRKFLLNIGDIVTRYNQELSPGGLPLMPLFLLLLVRNFKSILKNQQQEFVLLLILFFNILVFGLYFHNGGESYRGRYLSESLFSYYILLALLLKKELNSTQNPFIHKYLKYVTASNIIKGLMFIIIPSIILVQIKGDYFNANLRSPKQLSNASGKTIMNSLIIVKDLNEAGQVKNGFAEFPDEFNKNKTHRIPKRIVKKYINIGFPSMVATAMRIDENGYFRDKRENLFLGEVSAKELTTWKNFTKTKNIFELQFIPAGKSREKNWGVIQWSTGGIILKPLLRRKKN